mgnify:CR=1 FL=1
MKAETGPIGGDLSHEFIILAETGESQVFGHKDLLDFEIPSADLDFEGDLSPIVDKWTSFYAATDEMHDPERFDREVPADRQVSARGIEIGDRVVSSGLGGRFPKGLTVGYVTEVREQERDPLFKEVFLESSVDFRDLEEVFVIDPSEGR